MKKIVLFLFVLFISSISFAQETTLLHCGKLIDTENGTVLTERTIAVQGNKIIAIDKGYTQPKEGQTVVDLRSKTVMPGLIDMHVHIEGETSPKRYIEPFTKNEADVAFTSSEIAKRTLMAGFTTVRDLGGSGVNVSLRNAINKKELLIVLQMHVKQCANVIKTVLTLLKLQPREVS